MNYCDARFVCPRFTTQHSSGVPSPKDEAMGREGLGRVVDWI